MPAAAKDVKKPSKITVKIWKPLIDLLDEKMEQACLLRDSYLSRLITDELDWLESEIQTPNTEASRAFVSRRLDSLDRKFVSITLSPELIDRLTKLLNERAIVRDAFFNRLFLLLTMPPKVLEELLDIPADWMQDVLEDPGLTEGPVLSQVYRPLTPNFDPFFYYRQWMQDHDDEGNRIRGPKQCAREGIYSHFISQSRLLEGAMASRSASTNNPSKAAVTPAIIDLSGLNCFVADWRNIETEEGKANQAWVKSFLEELDVAKEKP